MVRLIVIATILILASCLDINYEEDWYGEWKIQSDDPNVWDTWFQFHPEGTIDIVVWVDGAFISIPRSGSYSVLATTYRLNWFENAYIGDGVETGKWSITDDILTMSIDGGKLRVLVLVDKGGL